MLQELHYRCTLIAFNQVAPNKRISNRLTCHSNKRCRTLTITVTFCGPSQTRSPYDRMRTAFQYKFCRGIGFKLTFLFFTTHVRGHAVEWKLSVTWLSQSGIKCNEISISINIKVHLNIEGLVDRCNLTYKVHRHGNCYNDCYNATLTCSLSPSTEARVLKHQPTMLQHIPRRITTRR